MPSTDRPCLPSRTSSGRTSSAWRSSASSPGLAGSCPLLLLAAYRLDELPPASNHREWRSRLLSAAARRGGCGSSRSTYEETALVTTLILGTGLPAPREVVGAVYERTNGIPLHIEELLGALGSDARCRRPADPRRRRPRHDRGRHPGPARRLSRGGPRGRAGRRGDRSLLRSRTCSPGSWTGPSPISMRRSQELVDQSVLYPFEMPRRGLLRLPPPAAARRALRHGPDRRAAPASTPARPSSATTLDRRHRRSTPRSTSSGPASAAQAYRTALAGAQAAATRSPAGGRRSSCTAARSRTSPTTCRSAELAASSTRTTAMRPDRGRRRGGHRDAAVSRPAATASRPASPIAAAARSASSSWPVLATSGRAASGVRSSSRPRRSCSRCHRLAGARRRPRDVTRSPGDARAWPSAASTRPGQDRRKPACSRETRPSREMRHRLLRRPDPGRARGRCRGRARACSWTLARRAREARRESSRRHRVSGRAAAMAVRRHGLRDRRAGPSTRASATRTRSSSPTAAT